jgi:GNAT superfamily N-acetyltransferase
VSSLLALGLADAEVRARLRAGHHAYVAYLDGAHVGYGWSATREADVGELGAHLRLVDGYRYLWDFFTLPDYRGRGLYPQLLQAILRRECANASHFWIGHDRENAASARGILRAGFRLVADVTVLAGGEAVVRPVGDSEHAAAAAHLFGLRLLADA